MSGLHVEIRDPDADLLPHWRDLAERATTNAFLDPAGLRAVRETGFAEPRVLVAWDTAATPARLVGLMALRAQKTFGFRHLWSVPHYYAFTSNPVIDPNYADDVVPAFLAEIACHPELPKVIRLQYLDGGDPTYGAILAALAGRMAHSQVLSERERAFVTSTWGIKPNSATRKKLRQQWNRLTATSTVEIVNERSESAARGALEIFLVMEAASWKGDRGTALLSSERDTAFIRRFVAAMAVAGNASVPLLRVDGKPIAAFVLFYAGAKAYTWKVAYDAEYSRFSPGALLAEKLTESFFAGGEITAIESCAPEEGFLYRLWFGRRPTVDLLVDLAPRRSLAFSAIAAHIRAQQWLSAKRHQVRTGDWPWKRPKAAPAAASAESSAKS